MQPHFLLWARSISSCVRVFLLSIVCTFFFNNIADAQLHFVSIGNWGFGNQNQAITAAALKGIAKQDHISYIISPGSNFAGGVSALNDSTWKVDFEDVYSDTAGSLKVPMFTVLGTEDWGSNYTAQILRTADANLPENSQDTFPKWTTPNWWYHYISHFSASTGSALISSGHRNIGICFSFIDTWILSSSFPIRDVSQLAWTELEATLLGMSKICDYIFVVGDLAIYSSGGYKGDSYLSKHLLPLLKQANVDAYITGNEFTLEALEYDGISHINCGSSSKGSSFLFSRQGKSNFFSGEVGFCAHEVTASGINTKFIESATGKTLFVHSQKIKTRPEKATFSAVKASREIPPVRYIPVPPMVRMPGKDIFVKVCFQLQLEPQSQQNEFREIFFLDFGRFFSSIPYALPGLDWHFRIFPNLAL
ncbi:acid phosphatase GAP50 [Cardiosporidium cionae]|uniref:Acid phosphatase GAP50 n=1 Tax=Cardiosporidium cionae TaxID=476202 RepID=A0ABQ7J989_9APIC|nr:acid phosphatase GAP50 [Cardiosporidium cionae]|eukprot:KAF8820569.1 acid phosphatase GAP50 [Cardiosporidium cionae]